MWIDSGKQGKRSTRREHPEEVAQGKMAMRKLGQITLIYERESRATTEEVSVMETEEQAQVESRKL